MNVHHIRYARAVMETRSFSRAAMQCHVSQPSLSIAVAQLEEELGEPLFLRSTRRLEITAFGAYMEPVLEDALRALDEVRVAADRFRGEQDTIVRLGLSPLIDARLMKRVIEPFERKSPDRKIIFKECMLDDLAQRLAAQRIDISCTVREKRASAGCCPLYSEPLLYLPQRPSRGAGGRPVQIRELAGEIFVLTVDGCGLSNAIRNVFQQNRVRLREYQGHALSYDVVEEWVELGIGSGILPQSKVKKMKQVARPILRNNGQVAELSYELRWNPKHCPSHVEAFVDHFRTVVPNLLRGGSWKVAVV